MTLKAPRTSQRPWQIRPEPGRSLLEPEAYQKQIELQYQLSSIFVSTKSLRTAGPKVLQAICETLGWALGEWWRVDDGDAALRLANFWHEEALEDCPLLHLDASLSIRPGEGLAGAAWQTGEPLFLADARDFLLPPRREAAIKAGLKGALVYPVPNSRGVMLFMSRGERSPAESKKQLETIKTAGRQLGLFLDQERSRARSRPTLRPELPSRESSAAGPDVSFAGLVIDRNIFGVRGPRGLVHLSRTEWSILTQLISCPGTVVSHQTLLDQVWGADYIARPSVVHDAVSRLRARLRQAGARDEVVQAVHGFGYRLLASGWGEG